MATLPPDLRRINNDNIGPLPNPMRMPFLAYMRAISNPQYSALNMLNPNLLRKEQELDPGREVNPLASLALGPAGLAISGGMNTLPRDTRAYMRGLISPVTDTAKDIANTFTTPGGVLSTLQPESVSFDMFNEAKDIAAEHPIKATGLATMAAIPFLGQARKLAKLIKGTTPTSNIVDKALPAIENIEEINPSRFNPPMPSTVRRGLGIKNIEKLDEMPTPEKLGEMGALQYTKPIGPQLPKYPTHDFAAMTGAVDAATQVEGHLAAAPFKDLRDLKIQGILDYNKNPASNPRFLEVKKVLDKQQEAERAVGIKQATKENYLPQVWEGDPKEIENRFKEAYRILGLKPSFTMNSIIKNYELGIDLGLKPKFDNIADLVHWRVSQGNKAIAHQKYFNYLEQNGMLIPSSKIGENPGFKSVEGFPFSYRTVGKDKLTGGRVILEQPYAVANDRGNIIGDLIQPKGEADKILSYFGNPTDKNPFTRFMKGSAGVATTTKNTGLMGGVRGYNAYGFLKSMMAGATSKPTDPKNLLGATESIKTLLQLGKSVKSMDADIEKALPDIAEYMKQGFSSHLEDYQLLKNEPATGWIAKAEKFFMEPVLKTMLLKKHKFVKEGIDDLVNSGMKREEAIKELSHQGNELYGGVNVKELGRDPTFQNMLRSIILAPDLTEGTVRTAGRLGKTALDFNNPKNQAYRNIMGNMLGQYVIADGINYKINKRHMYQNETNKLGIEVGKDDKGKVISIPLFYGVDAVRLPAEIYSRIANDGDLSGVADTVKGRLGILPQIFMNEVRRQDDLGRSLTRDNRGNPLPMDRQLVNMGREAIGPLTPPAIRMGAKELGDLTIPDAMKRYKFEDTSDLEEISTAGELPLRFRKKKRGTTTKTKKHY